MAREAQTVVTRRAQHRLLALTQALRESPPPGFAQVSAGLPFAPSLPSSPGVCSHWSWPAICPGIGLA